jgi:hypothetical protein
MREIRQSGSEGGVAPRRYPYPYSSAPRDSRELFITFVPMPLLTELMQTQNTHSLSTNRSPPNGAGLHPARINSCFPGRVRLNRDRLQTGLRKRLRSGFGRIAVVGLMLVLWLGVAGLSCSPELHRALHADSHQLSHECLVTSFTKGQFLFVCGAITLVVPVFFRSAPGLSDAGASDGPLDLRLGPSRAPPLFSFFSSVR